MIGGNTRAIIQVKTSDIQNKIGEYEIEWQDKVNIIGFLDLSSGETKYNIYKSKIQESTHIFITDYIDLQDITAENSRLIINDEIYDIALIDDPMWLHKQIEIYLKYTGGQSG